MFLLPVLFGTTHFANFFGFLISYSLGTSSQSVVAKLDAHPASAMAMSDAICTLRPTMRRRLGSFRVFVARRFKILILLRCWTLVF